MVLVLAVLGTGCLENWVAKGRATKLQHIMRIQARLLKIGLRKTEANITLLEANIDKNLRT